MIYTNNRLWTAKRQYFDNNNWIKSVNKYISMSGKYAKHGGKTIYTICKYKHIITYMSKSGQYYNQYLPYSKSGITHTEKLKILNQSL